MSKASVQFMITNEHKRKLFALGYGQDEVEMMEPALAMSVLKREMRRPWGDRPMPENWKRKNYQQITKRSGGDGGFLKGVLILGVVAAGAYFLLDHFKDARQKNIW
eukprot:CAMPEP_0118923904 /NCGR_PEP_ID=MMETSP1169-20130426/2264_1 /TAXON_ID=36882 /ORGANISM="Pyramimonas obovata, Strain CCMP722" /LENGTH=105 /DNA_ID=CAMNT_0006864963 /DNA_START=51 /DNA_END=365 /DNA_ORIENTATION=+